jgi:hypothetical protein
MTQRPPHTEAELVEFVRSIDVRAPESLHRSVHSLIEGRTRSRSVRPARVIAFLARTLGSGPRLAAAGGVLAALVLALVLSLGGGGTAAVPSLRQAAALTLQPATAAAPPQSRAQRGELAAAVDGVSFPYWEENLGWRSTGARADRVGGRQVTTVFYADGAGRQVGYAIVAGLSAPRVSGGEIVWRAGTPYRLLREDGAAVVTWLRAGHMCVVSGRGVNAATLLRLASWRGQERA